jgi:hypothetical protein
MTSPVTAVGLMAPPARHQVAGVEAGGPRADHGLRGAFGLPVRSQRRATGSNHSTPASGVTARTGWLAFPARRPEVAPNRSAASGLASRVGLAAEPLTDARISSNPRFDARPEVIEGDAVVERGAVDDLAVPKVQRAPSPPPTRGGGVPAEARDTPGWTSSRRPGRQPPRVRIGLRNGAAARLAGEMAAATRFVGG